MKLTVPPKLKKPAVYLAVVLLALLGWYFLSSMGSSKTEFRLASVQKGDLIVSVSATGTLEPEEVIDVGAQVAGKILSFGNDISGSVVDYGSEVESGAVLARIDDALYRTDVTQAEAQLQRAKADLAQYNAKFTQAEQDWERAKKLGASEALSQSNFDGFRAGFEIAKANVSVGEAEIVQAQSSLERAQRNLSYCTITSPVRGVIIDRRVNVGQTVVSSLNTPSLFLLAKDLRHMQIWIAVNEADIGSIHPGQALQYSVDTFPGEVFKGTVSKVRLNATMTQNVVTYTVEAETDNSNGRLLPYLTANVQFEVSSHKDVLLVPNAALRWVPKPERIEAEFRAEFGKTEPSLRKTREAKGSSPTLPSSNSPKQATEESRKGILWMPSGSYVKPIRVVLGASDGVNTEVISDALNSGDQVVYGENESGASANNAGKTNPFAPQIMRGRH